MTGNYSDLRVVAHVRRNDEWTLSAIQYDTGTFYGSPSGDRHRSPKSRVSASQFDLSGRTALVTGSSKGIGFALAAALASAGARVVLNARDEARLAQAAQRLHAQGLQVATQAFDVTDPAAVQAGVAGVESAIGAIDILVNYAGMQHRTPFAEFPNGARRRLSATNIDSEFLTGRAVAQRMVARGRGKIINVCSVQSEMARPSYIKAGLTQALVDDPPFIAWLVNRTPAGRWGDVHELADAAIFLASEASNFVNGHILYVDGGTASRPQVRLQTDWVGWQPDRVG